EENGTKDNPYKLHPTMPPAGIIPSVQLCRDPVRIIILGSSSLRVDKQSNLFIHEFSLPGNKKS
ncbi:MAG: hypothetical protein AAB073_05170, partial [Pseudomonadota bacterium]